jgi:hypothetical protein
MSVSSASRSSRFLRQVVPLEQLDVPAHQPLGILGRQVGALDPHRVAPPRRQEEHVAVAQQRVGPVLVQDRARVRLRGDAERDARGKFALMSPVMTFTDGRCVATMRWMPIARAFCASCVSGFSTSLCTVIMRSASSSTTTTM